MKKKLKRNKKKAFGQAIESNEDSSLSLQLELTLIYCFFCFTELEKGFKETKLYPLWLRKSE